MKTGVIYLAYGMKYVDEAVFSATSMKKFNPSLSVTLFTNISDFELKFKCFDNVIVLKENYDPYKMKIFAMLSSPYENTLFLDTDTKILNDVTAPFNYLSEHDIAIAGMRWLNPDLTFRDFEKKSEIRPGEIIFNTGVIYFRSSEAFKKFGDVWFSRVAKSGVGIPNVDRDQRQFNDMLDEALNVQLGLKIKPISNKIYNCRLLFKPYLSDVERKGIAILHEHDLHRPLHLFKTRIKTRLKSILKL